MSVRPKNYRAIAGRTVPTSDLTHYYSSTQRARDRAQALRSLIPDGQPVVYAFQLRDGTIKIGCSRGLTKRRNHYPGAKILGFMFGDEELERDIHRSLAAHVARGREYYHPTPEVLAVVNELRASLGLDEVT